jgi:hypothetical protein
MPYYLLFAFAWIALGTIKLYVAHTGTRSAGILSLSHSSKVTLSKRQRWWEGAIGIGFLGLGVAHMVLAYLHRT